MDLSELVGSFQFVEQTPPAITSTAVQANIQSDNLVNAAKLTKAAISCALRLYRDTCFLKASYKQLYQTITRTLSSSGDTSNTVAGQLENVIVQQQRVNELMKTEMCFDFFKSQQLIEIANLISPFDEEEMKQIGELSNEQKSVESLVYKHICKMSNLPHFEDNILSKVDELFQSSIIHEVNFPNSIENVQLQNSFDPLDSFETNSSANCFQKSEKNLCLSQLFVQNLTEDISAQTTSKDLNLTNSSKKRIRNNSKRAKAIVDFSSNAFDVTDRKQEQNNEDDEIKQTKETPKKQNSSLKKKSVSYADEQHSHDNSSIQTFKCPFCSDLFDNIRSYMCHYVVDHQEKDKSWKCFQCDQTFKSRLSFVAHVRQSICFNDEASVRKFECKFCDAKFKRSAHLSKHETSFHKPDSPVKWIKEEDTETPFKIPSATRRLHRKRTLAQQNADSQSQDMEFVVTKTVASTSKRSRYFSPPEKKSKKSNSKSLLESLSWSSPVNENTINMFGDLFKG